MLATKRWSVVFRKPVHALARRRYRVVRWSTIPAHAVRRLLEWQRDHARTMPWREGDVRPFHLLVAEMLLRRTRADMVAKVWPKVVERYPTPADLAIATANELEFIVRPLGLVNRRVVALTTASRFLVEQHAGVVPRTVIELDGIPYVGKYSAHMVACCAFGYQEPVIDVNVLRVWSRYIGQNLPVSTSHRSPSLWARLKRTVPEGQAQVFNYALLDLAAEVCTRMPRCTECPLSSLGCYYRRKDKAQPG